MRSWNFSRAGRKSRPAGKKFQRDQKKKRNFGGAVAGGDSTARLRRLASMRFQNAWKRRPFRKWPLGVTQSRPQIYNWSSLHHSRETIHVQINPRSVLVRFISTNAKRRLFCSNSSDAGACFFVTHPPTPKLCTCRSEGGGQGGSGYGHTPGLRPQGSGRLHQPQPHQVTAASSLKLTSTPSFTAAATGQISQ